MIEPQPYDRKLDVPGYCWIHNVVEWKPGEDVYHVCGECGHVFRSEEELRGEDGSHPVWACSECDHDF